MTKLTKSPEISGQQIPEEIEKIADAAQFVQTAISEIIEGKRQLINPEPEQELPALYRVFRAKLKHIEDNKLGAYGVTSLKDLIKDNYNWLTGSEFLEKFTFIPKPPQK